MGGYNTVSEILASGTPALLVPRETPRLEQLIRATALKNAGAIDLLRVTDLSTAALEDWLTERLSDQDAGTRSQLAGDVVCAWTVWKPCPCSPPSSSATGTTSSTPASLTSPATPPASP